MEEETETPPDFDLSPCLHQDGQGIRFDGEAFRRFTSAVAAALEAAPKSPAALHVQEMLRLLLGQGASNGVAMGIIWGWREGLARALRFLGSAHAANNDGLAPVPALQDELVERFFDLWAPAYLTDLVPEGKETTPLWTFVQTRWLDLLRSRWAERESRLPEVGVLFVHGIGAQRPGETLAAFGQPVIETFGDDARIRRTQLAAGPESPAHTVLDFPASGGTSWVLAESCWAGSFPMPSLGPLVLWILAVAPGLAVTHLGRWGFFRFRNVRNALSRGPFRVPPGLRLGLLLLLGLFGLPLLLAGSVLVALLLQVVALSAGIVALIPSLRTRALLARLLGFLQGVVGDSLAFTDNPIARSAIISHVRRDLEWLSRQVAQVVIVAHSQGAAVAHAVLQRSPPPNVRLLQTVGSGLGKLELVRRRSWSALQRSASWAVPTFPLYLWLAFVLWKPLESAIPYGGLFYGALFTSALVAGLRSGRRERSLQPIQWIDYYASHDPVPNGPLERGSVTPWVKSRQVHNFGSFFRDHTGYFQNRDEFIPALLADLFAHLRPSVSPPPALERHPEGARARLARLRSWRGFRGGAWLIAVAGLLLAGSGLSAIGLDAARLESALVGSQLLHGIAQSFSLPPGQGQAPSGSVFPHGYIAVGAGAYLILLAPFYLFGNLLWQAWNVRSMQSFLHAPDARFTSLTGNGHLPGPRLGFTLACLAVIVIATALTTAFLRYDWNGWIPRSLGILLVAGMIAPLMLAFLSGRWPSGTLTQLGLLFSLLGLAWVAFRTAVSASLTRPAQDFAAAGDLVFRLLQTQPEAFSPLFAVLLAPIILAILLTLQRS